MKRRLLAVALALLATVVAAVPVPASAARPALSQQTGDSFWTRLLLLYPDDPLYLYDESTRRVRPYPWYPNGEAWQFVHVSRPGWYNIYRIKAGDDTSRCMTTLNYLILAPVITAPCGTSNKFYWQIQAEGPYYFRLANVETGFCLAYQAVWGGDAEMHECQAGDGWDQSMTRSA